LIAPVFTAMPTIWIIPPAFGVTMWQPNTRRVSAQTIGFISTRVLRPMKAVCIGLNEVA
jgi:hypothetical protein